MGSGSAQKPNQAPRVEIDAWLRAGGLAVAASERAARAVAEAYHRARRAEGLAAWPAPNIQDWQGFVHAAWQERSLGELIVDGRLPLNPLQEQELWAGIIAASGQGALLDGPLHRIASLAMEAHRLLCAYAPRFLNVAARIGWQQDAEAFSGWLSEFDAACRAGNLVSPARLPLELIPALESDSAARPPLLTAGFDRLLPVQRSLFNAWGDCREAPLGKAAAHINFHEAADAQSELAACALWCRRQLSATPRARLLVVTQDVPKRRGEIERAFLRPARGAESGSAATLFEFSLGVPLGQVALTRGAHLVLRWLNEPIEENDLDWLLSTGQAAATERESQALTAFMRALRRRGLERTHWRLQDFIADFIAQRASVELPAAWAARITQAQRLLQDAARRKQTTIFWAELVPRLLEAAAWPGARALSSVEFQALRRWQRAVDGCASLGFDGRRIAWSDFLSALRRAADETLFAPESRDAPILIAGPAESAGLTADAVWFLGASEDEWPASGATHPLLPLAVQREAAMPHATAQQDWDMADAITRRMLASAPEVHFSYARQNKGVEARPSRLIMRLAGKPQSVPDELKPPAIPEPLASFVEDASLIPFAATEAHVEGGSSVLTHQSQCPFKAFATARLAAQSWSAAEAGLTAAQRGQLLHAVLHVIWGGPPRGIRTHADLLAITDRREFVERLARPVLRNKMPAGVSQWMPAKYLELEESRLIRLVTEWLEYESARQPFAVIATEVDASPTIAGLALELRLDRIDQLNDGSLLVIDYKSGNVTPASWDLPRPDDVQLPLYAGFGLDPDAELGGLVFAKVRAGERVFAGRVGDARATLLPDLAPTSGLARKRLTAEDLIDWRTYIERIARNFIEGRAEVDPRDPPKTCERCGLQTICRIQEAGRQLEAEDDAEDSEADDE